MTAAKYLSQADGIRKKIKAREAMKEEKSSEAEYKGINYDMVGTHGTGGNSTEAAFISAADFNAKVEREIAELQSQLREIKLVIMQVGSGVQELILTLRYIEGIKLEDVPQKINYSRSQMFRHYHRALKKVDEILKMRLNDIE